MFVFSNFAFFWVLGHLLSFNGSNTARKSYKHVDNTLKISKNKGPLEDFANFWFCSWTLIFLFWKTIGVICISEAFHNHIIYKDQLKNERGTLFLLLSLCLTLVTSACFLVGKTSEGGGIRPPPFVVTDWSDKKFYNKTFFS